MYNYSIGGQGVSQDHEKALDSFRKAVEAGYDLSVYEVGTIHYKGRGVAKDLEEARIWFETGSGRQQVDCKFMLGFMLVRGEGGPKEFCSGMVLIEAAASEGHWQAKGILAQYTAACASIVLSEQRGGAFSDSGEKSATCTCIKL